MIPTTSSIHIILSGSKIIPWGDVHVGTAFMRGNSSFHQNIYLEDSVLTLKATRNFSEAYNRTFNYFSGAVHAKQLLEVTEQYPSYTMCGDFLAPMIPGAWPAFWITATSWPPEVDILEFKGDNNDNFNIYIDKNTPTYWDQIRIHSSDDWNTYCLYMKRVNNTDVNNTDVDITFSLNNNISITHTATDYVGKQFWVIINLEMEGSSGPSGPLNDTYYYARNVYVT
ncbi:24203_t:CDS:2, partial [Cetraspora pellucida]